MNNQSPLVPQGTIDPKNKGRARVKIAVFFILAVHGVGLLALLLQGCHREETGSQASVTPPTNAAPAFEPTNVALVDTNVAPASPTNVVGTVETPTNTLAVASASEYTVASRDTFSTIGKKFGVSAKAIADANPGVEPTKLRIGQKLHIPAATKTTGTLVASAAPTAEAKATDAYQVKSGDTLIKIASEHHTTVRAIRTANNLKSNRITVGQKLKLPGKVASAPGAPEAAELTPATPAAVAVR